MFLVFGNQQVNGFLGDANFSDGSLRFRARECQFTLAQTAYQFQIEHGQQFPLIRGVEVGLDMLRLEDLHLEFLHLGAMQSSVGCGGSGVPSRRGSGCCGASGADGVLIGAADVDALGGLHSSGQLCLALRLRLAEDILDDALYCFHQRASSFLLSRPEVYGILFQRGVSQS